jgi:hypothetical protein
MLGLVPAGYVQDVEDIGAAWYYADISRQFESLGLHHDIDGPDFENEPFVGATYTLAVASGAFNYVLVEELTEAIGFQPLGVDQAMYVGAPGSQLSMFRADFDAEKLTSAWSAAGYAPYDTASGIPAWTIGPEAEIEFDHPIQNKVTSELNNVAILDDVLVYAPRMDLLEQVLSFVGSDGASVASDPVFEPLIQSLPESTISAIAFASLTADLGLVNLSAEEREPIEEQFEQALDEFGSMPTSTGIIAAVGEGAVPLDWEWPLENGTPVPNARENAGTAYIRIGTESPEDAARAVEVAAGRWNSLLSLRSRMPYADLAEVAAAEASGNIAKFDLVQAEHPGLWRELFLSRDVLPFIPV